MPSTAKLRRTWFALLRKIEGQRGSKLTDDERHDIQAEWTGKPSLRDWTPADFDEAIGGLQRAMGQHTDPRAHVREDDSPEPGDWATAKQAAWIEDLCDRTVWKTGRQYGPRRYACSTILRGDSKMLRRRRLGDAYDGTAPRADRENSWRLLTRREAMDLIRAMRKAAQVYPKEGTQTHADAHR